MPRRYGRFHAGQFPLGGGGLRLLRAASEPTAALCAERTPPGVTFNVKAFSLLTQHPAHLAALRASAQSAPSAATAFVRATSLATLSPGCGDGFPLGGWALLPAGCAVS